MISFNSSKGTQVY